MFDHDFNPHQDVQVSLPRPLSARAIAEKASHPGHRPILPIWAKEEGYGVQAVRFLPC